MIVQMKSAGQLHLSRYICAKTYWSESGMTVNDWNNCEKQRCRLSTVVVVVVGRSCNDVTGNGGYFCKTFQYPTRHPSATYLLTPATVMTRPAEMTPQNLSYIISSLPSLVV